MTVQNLLFRAHTLCISYVTNTFLLVSSSVRSKQLLCFVHGQGQKSKQKPTTKNFVEFHNPDSPLLTIQLNLYRYSNLVIDTLGQVVRKPVNVNPGLNVNWSIMFYCLKWFSPLMFSVVCDYGSSKLKGKQCKQKPHQNVSKLKSKFSLTLG